MKTRREFIKKVAGATALFSGCGLAPLLTGCVSVRFAAYRLEGDQVVVSRDEFLEDEQVRVSHDRLEAPIFLHKESEEEYTAVYLLCTHKQCDVKPAGAILACPCHGSEYTIAGKVLKGPAEYDLAQFRVTTDDKNIYIKTR